MKISKKRLHEMIRETIPVVARDLLEEMEDEISINNRVEIVGTGAEGTVEDKIEENTYWVSFENKEDGGAFEPRHLRIIENGD